MGILEAEKTYSQQSSGMSSRSSHMPSPNGFSGSLPRQAVTFHQSWLTPSTAGSPPDKETCLPWPQALHLPWELLCLSSWILCHLQSLMNNHTPAPGAFDTANGPELGSYHGECFLLLSQETFLSLAFKGNTSYTIYLFLLSLSVYVSVSPG